MLHFLTSLHPTLICNLISSSRLWCGFFRDKLQLDFELSLMERIFYGYIECTKQVEWCVKRDTSGGTLRGTNLTLTQVIWLVSILLNSRDSENQIFHLKCNASKLCSDRTFFGCVSKIALIFENFYSNIA